MAATVLLLGASLEAIGEPQGSGLVSRLHEKLIFVLVGLTVAQGDFYLFPLPVSIQHTGLAGEQVS